MISRRCIGRAFTHTTAAVSSMIYTSSVARVYTNTVLPISVTNAANVQIRSYADGTPKDDSGRAGQYILNKEDVLARVLEVVKNFEKVDASKVSPDSHFVNDLGLDSLDVVEVVMALEQEFILDIPDHDAEKIQCIPDAVEYIAQNPMSK